MGPVTDLVQCSLEFSVEPGVCFWSVVQAVGTCRVLCVFSQNLERLFTFGSSGFQCSEAIPDGFAAPVCFALFGGWICVSNLLHWAVVATWSFGDLIGYSAGTWLSAMLKWLPFLHQKLTAPR